MKIHGNTMSEYRHASHQMEAVFWSGRSMEDNLAIFLCLHVPSALLVVPARSFSRPHSRLHRLRRTVPDLKARVKRTLGQVPHTPQVMSPSSPKRPLQRTMTRRSSTIRTTISPTFQKPFSRAPDNSVFPHFLNPLFCTFPIGDSVPQRGSLQSGERKAVDVKEKSTEQCRESFSSTHRELYSDERDLREHFERRAQQTILDENAVQRIFFRLSTTW